MKSAKCFTLYVRYAKQEFLLRQRNNNVNKQLENSMMIPVAEKKRKNN